MCRPVDGFRKETCPGGHVGPPLRGVGSVREPTEIGAGRKHSPARRDGARPLQKERRRSRRGAPGVWLLPSKFQNGIWGVGRGHRPLRPAGGREGGTPRSRGNGRETRQRSPQKCPATPDNPSVTAFGRASSLYTREPLGTGDADCRVGPSGLLAMTMVFCHSEERSDVGIRPFYDGRWTGVRAAEVVGPYEWSTEVPATGRCGHRPLRVVAESCRDHPGSALSAERAAGQIQVLPDDLRVQHGAPGSEASARPRPCSRRGCGN